MIKFDHWIAVALVLISAPVKSGAAKPNNPFLFADGLSCDSVSFMNNSEVRPLRLDDLADSGTVFDNTYNSGAWEGTVCIASRTMLITGWQLWKAKRSQQKLKTDGAKSRPASYSSASSRNSISSTTSSTWLRFSQSSPSNQRLP